MPAAQGLPPPLGPEYDTDPPRDPDAPGRRYVVCSTQRSGSGLLCRGLTATGVAGVATEYFVEGVRAALAARWGCPPGLDAYARALRAHRTSPEGVFGTKLHWDQCQLLRAEALGLPRAEPEFAISSDFLEALMPEPVYLHILRRDVNAQAVSFWKALRSGTWSAAGGPAAEAERDVPYSFEGIDRCRRLIENGELHWDRFFRANRIQPREVVYEDLDSDYEGTLSEVLAYLVPDRQRVDIPKPVSRRLADAHSAQLLARFAADRRRRGLDDPLAVPV